MNKNVAASAFKDVVRMYRATARWLAWCDGLNLAKIEAGVYDNARGSRGYDVDLSVSVERAYTTAHKRPPNPTKAHKHRMYAAAYRAASLAEVDVEPGSIGDMEGIARVITRVTAALAAV